MILFRVASDPRVAEYAGADLSKQALAHVERTWKSHFDQVSCHECTIQFIEPQHVVLHRISAHAIN